MVDGKNEDGNKKKQRDDDVLTPDERVDENLDESFPASDPPGYSPGIPGSPDDRSSSRKAPAGEKKGGE